MVGNHLEEYIVPTSLAGPQVPAFVIIHKLVMLECGKTARHVLMESYFSTSWLKTCAILADILIGIHPCLDSSVNSILLMYLFLILSVFWRSPKSIAQGSSANTVVAG